MSNHATNARLPHEATKILRQWHKEHSDFPYPSPEEKTQLQENTGLSDKQISNWFTNTRRRTKSGSSHGSSASLVNSFDTMSSLDRWRNSPPELEHVSMEDIAAALAETNNAPRPYRAGRTSSRQSDASSVRASDTGSSDSQGILSETGAVTKHRRRRRKRPNAPPSKETAGKRIFQCTFCTDAFKTKYDWTRHEASLHLPLDRWTCTPHGPRYLAFGGSVQACVYCDLENPSDEHVNSHRISECCDKPATARQFYRKDHLRQHLRQVHKVEMFTKAMEGWKSRMTEIQSRCGFCDDVFQLWSERNEHLADHFRDGASMKDWKGARGFEPAVATLVRHSIPPYLISTEATAMIPFSVERGYLQQAISPEPHFPNTSTTPTSFEYLVSELGKFAIAQKAQNLIPTDQKLQEKARLIVYGDNDPWNQTAADNSQWLELFKEGYGITDSAPADPGQTEPLSFLTPGSQFPETLDLPWYWQSPECLAIYRRNKASFFAPHSINPPHLLNTSPEVSTRNNPPNLTLGQNDWKSNEHGQYLSMAAACDDWNQTGNFTQSPLRHFDQQNNDAQPPSTGGNSARQSTGSEWEGWDVFFPPELDLNMQLLFG